VTVVTEFSECDDIVDAAPLRQGDVVRRLSEDSDPWADLGVIVTADCDIAREKHHGRLSYVPLLPVEYYLALSYLPRRLGRVMAAIAGELLKIIHKAQAGRNDGFTTPISADRAERWLTEATPERVANTLGLAGADRDKMLRLGEILVQARAATPGDYSMHRRVYCEAEVRLNRSASTRAVWSRLAKDVASHLKDLPGDAMFLSSVGRTYDSGYIAYLRVLRELRDEQVAVRASHRSFAVTHERISHLRAPYIYAMTQKLGAVFSAIGLPSEYESSRERIGLRLTVATDEVD